MLNLLVRRVAFKKVDGGAAITLHVLAEKKAEEWVAICLEMDLVATGKTQAEVKKNMFDLIRAQVSFAIDNNNQEAIFKVAPIGYWIQFAFLRMRHCNKEKLSGLPPFDSASFREVSFCIG